MKPVIRNVLLALGLLPMSVFADASEESYEGQANITGMYGFQDSSYGEIDLWQPLWQEWDRTVFGDVRASKGNSNSWETNVGGGYRWLAFDEQFLFGAYSFYDYKNSAYNNGFQQFTFGEEVKTVDWTQRANYYLPISAGFQRAYAADTWLWGGTNTNGYQNLLISKGYEYGFGGFDFEVGRLIPGAPGLTTYAGMFYFNNNDIDETLVGPRLRVEYDLAKIVNIPLAWANGWVRNVQIEGAWQYDDVRGNLWNIGVQVSIPFSNRPEPSATNDIRSRMTEYVRRDINVVTQEKNLVYQAYEKNGTVWEFANIDNSTQFNSVLNNATQPNAYVINGNVDANAGNIQLQDNMLFTGWKFEYEPGHFFALTNQMGTINAPQDSDLFILGSNNTIRDLNLFVTQNTGGQPYYVLKNNGSNPGGFPNNAADDPSGSTVGTLVVDNINATGALFVAVGDGSQDSNVTVTNSTFNMGGTTGFDQYTSPTVDDPYASVDNSAINLETWNASGMTVSAVDNNTVNMGDNVKFGIGITILNNSTGTQTIHSVSGNTVIIGANDLGDNPTNHGVVHGILVANFGIQNIDLVNNNTITVGALDSNNNRHFHGIIFYNDYNTSTQTITGSVNNNTINIGDYAGVNGGYAIGIFFNNYGIQDISGTVSANTITFGDNVGAGPNSNGYVSGIEFDNCYTAGTIPQCTAATSQTIGAVNDNMITFGINAGSSTGSAVYGIYFDNAANNTISSSQSVESVGNNAVTFGNNPGANGGTAYGFYFENDATGTSIINNVTGNTVIGTPTYNIYILNTAAANTMTINIHDANGISVNGVAAQENALSNANNGADVYIDTINGNDITMTK